MGGGLHKFIDSSTAVPSFFPDMPAKCDQPASCSGHLLTCCPYYCSRKASGIINQNNPNTIVVTGSTEIVVEELKAVKAKASRDVFLNGKGTEYG